MELDARGLFCPIPRLRASELLRTLPRDEPLVVLATDPEAPLDLAALAADRGRTCTAEPDGDGWRMTLR
jgi:tRNA 2-thiouridine synthesizing protein A